MSRITNIESNIIDWSANGVPPVVNKLTEVQTMFQMVLKRFLESDSTVIKVDYNFPDDLSKEDIQKHLSSEASSYRNAAHAIGHSNDLKVIQRYMHKALFIQKVEV